MDNGMNENDPFQNTHSAESKDAFGMGTTVSANQDAFGADTTATGGEWENSISNNGTFQASSSGMYADSGSVAMDAKKSYHFFLGLIGALVGILLGWVIGIILFKLEYIEGLSGLAMILFSIKGYSILGKGIDLKGFIVCIILTLCSIWFLHQACWAYEYMNSMSKMGLKISYGEAFSTVADVMKSLDYTTDYYRDLFIGYFVTIVAGIPMVKKALART